MQEFILVFQPNEQLCGEAAIITANMSIDFIKSVKFQSSKRKLALLLILILLFCLIATSHYVWAANCGAPTKGNVVDNGDGTCTWTWQPNAADGKDAWIRTQPYPAGNGTDIRLLVGSGDGTSLFWSLCQFVDAENQIPAGSTINSAYEYYYKYSQHLSGGGSLHGERITSTWIETEVTDSNKPGTSTPNTDTLAHQANGTWYKFNIIDIFTGWFNGTYTNYGIMYKGSVAPETNDSDFLASSDYTADVTKKPKIEITYTPTSAPPKGTTVDNGDGTYTWTWQPDAADGKDAWIDSGNPDTSHETADSIVMYSLTTPREMYTLIQFTALLDNVPAGSTINSAYFRMLEETVGTSPSVKGHMITSSWDENVTWNTKPNWSNTYVSDILTAKNEGNWWRWTVTDIIQKIRDESTDYGFLFKQTGAGGSGQYQLYTWSSDAANAANRPKIEVTYSSIPLPNSSPNTPTSLSQYKSDCSTSISTGGWTNETTVCLKGYIDDPDTSDNVKLQIDYTTGTFDSVVDASSTAWCTDPCTASTSISSLSHGSQYKWQARSIDDDSATSSWAQFNGDIAFGVDTTAPSGGSITYTDGYYTTTSVDITYTLGTDSDSGLDSSTGKIQRKEATLSEESCGSWGSWSDLVTESDGSYTDNTVVSGKCYQYQYLIKDNANNQATYTSTNIAKVDTTGPPVPEYNVWGWAWSENIGWISFNNTSGGGSVNYEVSINPDTGIFSGYAWSENIGWISFNSGDLAGCPSGTCQAKLDLSSYQVSGWARVLSQTDGWIHLRGTNYGVSLDTATGPPYEFKGWAWEDTVTGWLSFNCENCEGNADCDEQGACNGTHRDYKVMTDLTITFLNEPPLAVISCDPSNCTVYETEPLLLINDSTDPNGQDDIVKSEWSVKVQGAGDETYQVKLTCTTDPILCNYTPQLEVTPGLYTAKLYVEDTAGASDTDTKNFQIKTDISAGFECSLDEEEPRTWHDCESEEIEPIVGDTIYFRDTSTASEGAIITERVWKKNGATFDSDNNPNPSTEAIAGAMEIQLTVTDSAERTDSIPHTISGERLLPKWQEIPPF